MIIGTFTAGTAGAAVHIFPTPVDGVKAAAKAFNAAGGMNGHQVTVIACDNQGDPNQAATCARNAKSDGVVAVVGSFDPAGSSQTLPILQSEGIPYLGATSTAPVDYSNPDAWPIDGGGGVSAFGVIADLIDQGCKSVSLLSPDSPANEKIWASAEKSFDAAGITHPSSFVKYDMAAVDLTPNVSTLLSQKSDCDWLIASPNDVAKIITTIKKLGGSSKLFTPYGTLAPAVLSALGSAGDGVNIVSATPLPSSSDPAMVQFRADMTANGTAKSEDGFSVAAWAGMQLLALVTKGLPTVTAATVSAKLPTMSNFSVGGYPEISFTAPFDNPTYPRMFDRQVRYYVTKGGQYVPVGTTAHDVTKYINQS